MSDDDLLRLRPVEPEPEPERPRPPVRKWPGTLFGAVMLVLIVAGAVSGVWWVVTNWDNPGSGDVQAPACESPTGDPAVMGGGCE